MNRKDKDIKSNHNLMHYDFRLVGRILDVICIYVYACASMQKQGRCININK